MKSLIVSLLLVTLLGACANPNPRGYDTEDLMADYCDQAGPRRTTANTGTTVQSWDHEATTAGHRGTRTDDVLEPDPNLAKPHGC